MAIVEIRKNIETLDQDSWKTEQWVGAWGADEENRAEGKDSCREAQQGTKMEKKPHKFKSGLM